LLDIWYGRDELEKNERVGKESRRKKQRENREQSRNVEVEEEMGGRPINDERMDRDRVEESQTQVIFSSS
jgi:hypothetical protein